MATRSANKRGAVSSTAAHPMDNRVSAGAGRELTRALHQQASGHIVAHAPAGVAPAGVGPAV